MDKHKIPEKDFKKIHRDLCKGIRAVGIPKKQALSIVNQVSKWLGCNGVEWTNSRIKDYRQWYETYLTGNPQPPKWFKKTRNNMPKDIFRYVFKLPKAKALGVLACNTAFTLVKPSQPQIAKFEKALQGNGFKDIVKPSKNYLGWGRKLLKEDYIPKKLINIESPTIFDMTGSCPVEDGTRTLRPNGNKGIALKALEDSWRSIPQVTFDFLDRMDMLDYMPLSVLGNAYQLELDRPRSSIVGRVSFLQQPQCKLRTVGNPNRVLQVTLEPLKKLYMGLAKNLKTDVTFDQESGVAWVQQQLKAGVTLAGSDMTSASDLLEVRSCLNLVTTLFDLSNIKMYKEFVEYFYQVSRSNWYCPELGREVKWQQGNVLGTGPSFGLLTLTNNSLALLAYFFAQSKNQLSKALKPEDTFRVVGDDIIMRAEMAPFYTNLVERFGGEINHSKTLTSNLVAEFAGRIITADNCYLKAIKYNEPSDNSFMSYVSQLGLQAKYFLRPKQRQVFEKLKEVPGIAVPGPFLVDSYGLSFTDRYNWYLEEVQPLFQRIEPDRTTSTIGLELLKAQVQLEAEGQRSRDTISSWNTEDYVTPFFPEDYLSSETNASFKVGGDPRLTDGKTMLDSLYEKVVANKDFKDFSSWTDDKEQQNVTLDEIILAAKQESSSISNASSKDSNIHEFDNENDR